MFHKTNHILGENKDEFVNPLPLMISRRPLWGTLNCSTLSRYDSKMVFR